MPPVPLTFRPHFKPVVWGGLRLREIYGPQCPDGPVGEAWLVSDREGAWSRVDGGPHAGRTLGDVVADDPEAWLGREVVADTGSSFPLLVKVIDAAEDLSVQVHPDEAAARAAGAPAEAKTECWWILDAEPGARIYLGLREGVSEERLRAAIADGTLPERCTAHRVSPGDFYFVPAGAIHAVGAGVRLLEIQESSDTTYRLHDWGRIDADGRPRTLHLEEGLRVARSRPRRAGRPDPRPYPGLPYARDVLVECDAFTVERLRFALPATGRTSGRRFHLAVVVAGQVELECGGRRQGPFAPWSSILLPASLGEYAFRPLDGSATMLLAAPGGGRLLTPPAERIRLQKVLAAAGIGSRRESERMITDGRVTVDGVVVTELGVRVDVRSQAILVDGERLAAAEPKVYYLLNKPRGVVCTNRDDPERPRAVDLVPGERRRLYTIGRLDIDSEGAILLTNDGEFAFQVAHPRFEVPKVYLAQVRGRLEAADLERIEQGVWLSDGKVGGITVQTRRVQPGSTWLRVILREGRNREIRRVFARLGYPVKRLKRVRIGGVSLKGLAPGETRPLTEREVERLRRPGSQGVDRLAANADDAFLPPRSRRRGPAPDRARGSRRGAARRPDRRAGEGAGSRGKRHGAGRSGEEVRGRRAPASRDESASRRGSGSPRTGGAGRVGRAKGSDRSGRAPAPRERGRKPPPRGKGRAERGRKPPGKGTPRPPRRPKPPGRPPRRPR